MHERGRIFTLEGDLEDASRYASRVRDLYKSLENDFGTVTAALNLAEIEHERGATASAVQIVKEELARAERLPERQTWAHLMENLAGYQDALDDVASARESARAAIAFFSSSDPGGSFAAIGLEHMALALAIEGHCAEAAIVEGYVERTLTEQGFVREYTERVTHERLTRMLQTALSEDDLAEQMALGAGLSATEARTIATAPEATT